MLSKSQRMFLAAGVVFVMTGCGALHEAMHEIGDHYKAARTHAEAEAYADADAEVGKVETILASDDVAKANDEPRFVELHAQLTLSLAEVRVGLQAENAAEATAAFEESSATCKACHKDYR